MAPWLPASGSLGLGRLATRRIMKIPSFIIFGSMVFVFVTGCAGRRELQHVDALRRDPGWPAIRAEAEEEVTRRKGNAEWSHSAYYAPQQHTNGMWVAVASGAYPLNRLGDSIDMLIRDSGEVVSYAPRMSSHPR
jgi:hypothetical protein